MNSFHPVTQTDSLPYRRMVFCGSAADCQSATQQINNLRYVPGTLIPF